MKINELLEVVPIDQQAMQYLNPAVEGVKLSKGHSVVTFATDTDNLSPQDLLHDTGRVGIIIWIDRDAYKKAVG